MSNIKKSEASLTGYINNVKELVGESVTNHTFSIGYSIPTVEQGKYENVFVSAKTIKGISVEGLEGKLCQFTGYITAHNYKTKEGKEKSQTDFMVREVSLLEDPKKGINKYVISGYPVNLKTLSNGATAGSLSFKVKTKEGVEEFTYIPFIAKKGIELTKGLTTIEGFISGDKYKTKDGKTQSNLKFFIMKAELVPQLENNKENKKPKDPER